MPHTTFSPRSNLPRRLIALQPRPSPPTLKRNISSTLIPPPLPLLPFHLLNRFLHHLMTLPHLNKNGIQFTIQVSSKYVNTGLDVHLPFSRSMLFWVGDCPDWLKRHYCWLEMRWVGEVGIWHLVWGLVLVGAHLGVMRAMEELKCVSYG